MKRLRDELFRPVDIASIVVFRIGFGALMVWEFMRYFQYGWIDRYYIDPQYHFSFFGFRWAQPWPGDFMYLHFGVATVLAAMIALGSHYRVAAALFFVAFTHIFLAEKAKYLNHFYLICLLSLLMAVIPAHRAFSVDARQRPKLRSATIPAWCVWLLRAQLAIVYFYAAVAKMNWDWLRGEPMRAWLSTRTDVPIIGSYFTEEPVVYLFSYGGLALDLFIAPLLLWRRTRVFAYLWAASFHLLNYVLFNIGVFPWMMLAATTIFFEPDWPRRLLRFVRRRQPAEEPDAEPWSPGPLTGAQRGVVTFLAVYLSIQVLVPLRHFLYPGNVNWTEEGHRFSWHMKLRDKDGSADFFLTDRETGETWEVYEKEYLNSRQRSKMRTRPDMLIEFVHYLAELERAKGRDVSITAEVRTSLNGRERQLMIDPERDLTQVELELWPPADWIVPLTTPLVSPSEALEPAEPDSEDPEAAGFGADE